MICIQRFYSIPILVFLLASAASAQSFGDPWAPDGPIYAQPFEAPEPPLPIDGCIAFDAGPNFSMRIVNRCDTRINLKYCFEQSHDPNQEFLCGKKSWRKARVAALAEITVPAGPASHPRIEACPHPLVPNIRSGKCRR